MHLAYVSPLDARDVRSWSGIPYFIHQALGEHVERVSLISPLAMPRSARQVSRKLTHLVQGKHYHRQHTEEAARQMSREVDRQLAPLRPDAVLAPTTLPFAFTETDLPIASWTDATFESNLEFYGGYADLPVDFVAEANGVEARALARIDVACYAADYAARSARGYYGLPAERVHTVPFGANLETPPSSDSVERAIEARPTDRCRLLFLGADWYRKGGDVAVRVVDRLNDAGLPTDLYVAGPRTLPEAEGHPHVHALGFISKATPEGRAQFDRLLLDSHFLLLPTRVEAYGCVFCEASAFGVPSLTAHVGGTPTAVADGVNGLVFPTRPAPDAIADRILGLLADGDAYRALCRSSRARYETELNWDVAVGRVVAALAACL